MHAGPNLGVQPWFTIFGAEDDVNDDLAQRLGHGLMLAQNAWEMNRAFSACFFWRR